MDSVLLVSLLILALLCACVLATMVVENWSRIRVPIRQIRTSLQDPRPPVASVATAEPTAERRPLVVFPEALPPEALLREPMLQAAPAELDELHVIHGRARADQLVAVLLASYAASRGPEANRAAAWVTSIGWPPEVAGAEFRPGADLRGRPAAVGRLLRCDSGGRCWVTLNESVDIGRGLSRRPPGCPTLAGVVDLWAASRAALSQIPADELTPMINAITALESQWRGTSMAPEVLSLLVALTDASDTHRSVRLQITNAPLGVAHSVQVPTPAGRSAS